MLRIVSHCYLHTKLLTYKSACENRKLAENITNKFSFVDDMERLRIKWLFPFGVVKIFELQSRAKMCQANPELGYDRA